MHIVHSGDLIAVQNTGLEDQEDQFWIGKVEDARDFKGAAGPDRAIISVVSVRSFLSVPV